MYKPTGLVGINPGDHSCKGKTLDTFPQVFHKVFHNAINIHSFIHFIR